MSDIATEARLTGDPGVAERALPWRRAIRWVARLDAFDIATAGLLVALIVIALCTFRDYAISNDEGVQHHYGELIIAYYRSGFADQSVFSFQNLYLYGGLFDIISIALGHLVPIDPYDLRHILCALIGIGGIGATAATARLIAGPRAALIAAASLSVCGAWYGTMFNHTKDIPFAAAMMGATLFLIRIARRLPSPRVFDVAAFGLLTGAALGMRVLGLLLLIYLGFAIALYLPRPWRGHGSARWGFVMSSALRLLPALLLGYVIMIVAWPWAGLAPLNPIRGLLVFSEFQYSIHTVLDGKVYEMADVPRLYVPIYILIRVPLLILFGAAVATMSALLPRLATGSNQPPRRDIILVALTVIFPVTCEVAFRGPAFTGLRHFLFVIPAIAALAGIGLDRMVTALTARGRWIATGGLAAVTAGLAWNAVVLVRLHPYEYLFYNPVVGGLEGASRRYDLDYWFASMPEAIDVLEAYVRRAAPDDAVAPSQVYSVAVCGERLEFDKKVTLPQLRWDFRHEWNQSEFFIAPTQMNCDGDLDGKVIGTVERLGVPIAYIKDRRALIRPSLATAAR
jgi:dolichyl-phosphate-mannose-protein mannosyltransferase